MLQPRRCQPTLALWHGWNLPLAMMSVSPLTGGLAHGLRAAPGIVGLRHRAHAALAKASGACAVRARWRCERRCARSLTLTTGRAGLQRSLALLAAVAVAAALFLASTADWRRYLRGWTRAVTLALIGARAPWASPRYRQRLLALLLGARSASRCASPFRAVSAPDLAR